MVQPVHKQVKVNDLRTSRHKMTLGAAMLPAITPALNGLSNFLASKELKIFPSGLVKATGRLTTARKLMTVRLQTH